MIAEKRVYRTVEGTFTLDPAEGAFLAFAEGDEVSPEVAELLAPEKPSAKAPEKRERAKVETKASEKD